MRLSRTTPALLVATLLVFPGCVKDDPIQALLDDLEAAAEAKSADGILEHLADDFRGQGGIDRVEAMGQLRRYLAAYEKVELEVYDVAIQRAEGSANVAFQVEFTGQALTIGGLGGLLPPGASYRFDLQVVERGGAWKVLRAAWESVAPPGTER